MSAAAAPPKPQSAFLLFSKDAREKLNAEPVPPTPKEIMAKIGELWRALPVEEKAVYEKMAAEAKTAFVLANPGAKGVKKAPKPDGEKRAPNAFMRFTAAKRAEVKDSRPGIATTEISKVIGEMWRALSEAEKESWKGEVKAAPAN